jgi:uncharacterized repeat protein (TIGR03803 family)
LRRATAGGIDGHLGRASRDGAALLYGRQRGAFPESGLIADSSGNLYGTTVFGGGSGCRSGFLVGCGTVFKLSPDGSSYKVLYSFTGGSDGAAPAVGLRADSSGNLYGTTAQGGAAGKGVVFKLSPDGTETVLYSFCSKPSCSDGANPVAGLIADSSGNLYGTTIGGGAFGAGAVFKLAGTGFVTAVPFSAFSGKLSIAFGPSPNTDSFNLDASFTLGSARNGINPPAEPVTLKVGTFSTTIPPGSFHGTGFGRDLGRSLSKG